MRWLGVIRRILEDRRPAPDCQDKAGDQKERREYHVSVTINIPQPVADEYRAHQQTQRRRYWITTGILFLTLVAVVSYTIVSCNQWGVAKQQVQATRDVVEQTERAWIVGTSASVDYGDGVARVHALARNSGKSPALHVRSSIRLSWELIEPAFDLSGDAMLAPIADQFLVFQSEEISRETVADLLAKKRTLFAWLQIKYRDPFSADPTTPERETVECWMYNLSWGKTPIPCPRGQRHT